MMKLYLPAAPTWRAVAQTAPRRKRSARFPATSRAKTSRTPSNFHAASETAARGK